MEQERELLPGVTLGPLPALTEADLATEGIGVWARLDSGARLQIGSILVSAPDRVYAIVEIFPGIGLKELEGARMAEEHESVESATEAIRAYLASRRQNA